MSATSHPLSSSSSVSSSSSSSDDTSYSLPFWLLKLREQLVIYNKIDDILYVIYKYIYTLEIWDWFQRGGWIWRGKRRREREIWRGVWERLRDCRTGYGELLLSNMAFFFIECSFLFPLLIIEIEFLSEVHNKAKAKVEVLREKTCSLSYPCRFHQISLFLLFIFWSKLFSLFSEISIMPFNHSTFLELKTNISILVHYTKGK